MPGTRQARVPPGSELRCKVSLILIHEDTTEARCVTHRDHQLDDTDHIDEHGHHAPVLVRQSTIEEVRRVTGEQERRNGDD